MEKEPIALASRLLVKAQGTSFDAEAAALTAKAYRLLAEALNAHDDRAESAGAARKRERRLLHDRRATSGSVRRSGQEPATDTAPIHLRPANWVDLPAPSHVDLLI